MNSVLKHKEKLRYEKFLSQRGVKTKKRKEESSAQRGRQYSKRMQKEPTEAEQILCEALIENNILFEFQKVWRKNQQFYITDFYFKSDRGKKYVIEVDGWHHFTTEGREHDKHRTNFLKKNFKIKVLRFSNGEVRNEIDKVMRWIFRCKPIVCEKRVGM